MMMRVILTPSLPVLEKKVLMQLFKKEPEVCNMYAHLLFNFFRLFPIWSSLCSPFTLLILSPSHLTFFVLSQQQVFWGQEHLNCLKLIEEHLRAYFHLQKGDSAESCAKGKACHTQPPPSPGSPSPRTEHSSDDLRTGRFQYIQDSGECQCAVC